MKAILTIFSLSIILCFKGEDERKPSTIMEFVYSSYGKKIGAGNCQEFVVAAMETEYKDFYTNYWSNDSVMSSMSITDGSEVGEGDIILTFDTTGSIGHTGIITDISGDTVIVASQNLQSYANEPEIDVMVFGKKMKAYAGSEVVYQELLLSELNAIGDVYVFNF